jgi:Ricin-type beta-trefoil lectin domain
MRKKSLTRVPRRWRHIVMATMVAVVTLLGPVVAFTGTASASTAASGPYSFVDSQTGRCLDSNSSGSVYTLSCNGGTYQKWSQVFLANGSYYLVDAATGRCLDSNSSGSAYTLRCNGGDYQKWYDNYDLLDGQRYIIDQQTGRCLDSNYNGNVYTLPCSGNYYQTWRQ